MAKLVKVMRSEEYEFERRQHPLQCDDSLTMVIQFEDACGGCKKENMKQKELESFVERFHLLSSDEIAVALMVTTAEITSMLSQLVPCVGCRRSVDGLFNQLVESGHPAFEPLIITKISVLSIKREYLFDPKALFALFYIHGSKFSSVMESIPKSKKNKRCALHSLDSHTCKTKTLGIWMDVWELLSTECREEVVLIECDSLMETVENYLRKHRFCTECKSKVLKAYNILVEEVDAKTEKGYVASLFENLRCCQQEKHIHVSSNTDFISQLITRAEPELMGSRRERHAKTLDIAQEEVLTCLGIHLYERLHKIWQKLKAEEQTWQILFHLGIHALRKNFEVALEKKRGISNLELMCEELLQEEQAKEQRRELKKAKKKKKKTNKSTTSMPSLNKDKNGDIKEAKATIEAEKDKENCSCDENTNVKSQKCNSCDDDHHKMTPCNPCNIRNKSPKSKMKDRGKSCQFGSPENLYHNNQDPAHNSHNHSSSTSSSSSSLCNGSKHHPSPTCGSSSSQTADCGYSSGLEGCDNCSIPSSRDGSDVACSEGICNHDGDSVLCHKDELVESVMSCKACDSSGSPSTSPQHRAYSWSNGSYVNGDVKGHRHKTPCHSLHNSATAKMVPQMAGGGGTTAAPRTLQDMLEEPCSGSEEEVDDFKISEEEIRLFKANQKVVDHQRDQLREVLRQRFANLQMRNPKSCSFMN